MLGALLCLAQGCVAARGVHPSDSRSFLMPPANSGVEEYSAWFADSDGRVLYFGLSPFWQLWWQSDGDARADLREPGDHLIGRFDLATERFLPPLRVRDMGPQVRSSVWDVLVHSSGRICFTTYYEEIGCVDADGRNLSTFEGVGVGFNELVEGPGARLYATRYSSRPTGDAFQGYGAVVVFTIDGELVHEFRLDNPPGEVTAPKSIAVDPESGEIWLNTDTFSEDGTSRHETIQLSADGEVLGRRGGSPELHFMGFDGQGRGWFAEDREGELWVRLSSRGQPLAEARLGAAGPVEFIQDIQFAGQGRAVLTLWSGRVFVVQLEGAELRLQELILQRPDDCVPSIFYTAVLHGDRVYATLSCRGRIIRAD
jgi:hypothetical protein